MRVHIETDVELYPETTLDFGEEIVFPRVPKNWERPGIDVPDDVAARWRAARDTWQSVQEEAVRFAADQA